MIRKLFEAGADVFRINISDTSKMRELVATIRNVEFSYGRPIGILVICRGRSCGSAPSPKARPSSRTARVSCSIPTRRRADSANSFRIRSSSAALRPGHALLLDDGKVRLIAEGKLLNAR